MRYQLDTIGETSGSSGPGGNSAVARPEKGTVVATSWRAMANLRGVGVDAAYALVRIMLR